MVSYFLKAKVDPNMKDKKRGRSLLFELSSRNLIEISKILIEHGCDVNTKDDKNESCLTFSYSILNYEMVKLLLNSGAKDIENLFSLSLKNKQEEKDFIDFLITHISEYKKEFLSPFLVLCCEQNEPNFHFIRSLLEKSIYPPHLKIHQKIPLIFLFCQHFQIDILKLSLTKGFHLKVEDEEGNNSLTFILVSLPILFSSSHSFTISSNHHHLSLPSSTSSSSSSSNLSSKTLNDNTSSNNDISTNNEISSNKFDELTPQFPSNTQSNEELFIPSIDSVFLLVQTLIQQKIDPNKKNNAGKTALHISASLNPLLPQIIDILLDFSDIKIKDSHGKDGKKKKTIFYFIFTNLFYLAVEMISKNENVNIEIFEMFLKKKCSASEMFFYLCKEGNLTKEFITFFVKKGVKVEEENVKMYTALDLSLFNPKVHRDLVKFLIWNSFFYKFHLNQKLIQSAQKDVLWEGDWKDNRPFSGRGILKIGFFFFFNL